MDSYRLPGHKIATASDGTGEIPDVLIVGDSLFRHFRLGDGGSFPIAFRSDTRPSADIYRTGFQRKRLVVDWLDTEYTDSSTKAKRKRLDDARQDIAASVTRAMKGRSEAEVRTEIARVTNELERESVALRVGNVDLDVETAVCATLDFQIASLFPFDPQALATSFAKPTSIYVVRMRHWLETYKVQRYAAPHLAYSREVASLSIPAGDVLGCLTVSRRYLPATNSVEVWVTAAEINATTDGEAIVKAVAARFRDPVTVATPAQKDTSSAVDADEKVGHIRAALTQLTGNPDPTRFVRDSNIITGGSTPKELPDYTPVEKTGRRLSQ
ncbi:hypothetical protein ACIBJE_24125 [Micromonospora sp. NPDC050187]|uniref:hypothetical protein n=1 Tax=Micromonospora sp. NPDC050187 TaxID=3364277 RepID=UPI0037931B9D